MAPIPTQMKAIQVTEYHKPYVLNSVPVPSDLGPYDLLVKVAIASYCHTDSMVSSGVFGTSLPVTASHEGSGTVVLTGSSVSGLKPGDRVMCGLPLHPCGACPDCLGPEESWRQYCPQVEGHVGVHVDGCLAEYVRVDSRSTTPLPDEVSLLSAAPLACAGRTVWRGVLQTELKAGQWVAIVGSGGGLGHLGIQFAKRTRGLNVIGIDARDAGLELSRKNGADVVVDARKGKAETVAKVQQVTGGQGADATIVLSDAADAAALACAVTKMHGTVVQIAQPDEVTIPFHEFIFRDIRIRGSVLCSPEESKSMLRAVAEHGITVKTNQFQGLEQTKELIELVRSGKLSGKAVVVVDPEQMEAEKNIGVKC
ncbi:chaperonin 10-like protein [Xylariales sp. AK1849]|nr:chaperonin 10-like protein [Xylariales sp. AK1849]